MNKYGIVNKQGTHKQIVLEAESMMDVMIRADELFGKNKYIIYVLDENNKVRY